MLNASREFDFIVIGSGFGGSVAAHRLTEKGYRVTVMEMDRRWTPENLPRTSRCGAGSGGLTWGCAASLISDRSGTS